MEKNNLQKLQSGANFKFNHKTEKEFYVICYISIEKCFPYNKPFIKIEIHTKVKLSSLPPYKKDPYSPYIQYKSFLGELEEKFQEALEFIKNEGFDINTVD
jgi:hypothetical protein